MDSNVRTNLQKMLEGQVNYSSGNLAFNMLINRLKRKVSEDPGSMAGCIKEIEDFGAKYPKVAAADFSAIAGL